VGSKIEAIEGEWRGVVGEDEEVVRKGGLGIEGVGRSSLREPACRKTLQCEEVKKRRIATNVNRHISKVIF